MPQCLTKPIGEADAFLGGASFVVLFFGITDAKRYYILNFGFR
jgi:hypothetical protein